LRNWSVPSPSWFLWHAGSSNFFQYFPPPLFENESVVLCTLTVLFSTKYLQFILSIWFIALLIFNLFFQFWLLHSFWWPGFGPILFHK
jgi:hypothetical protein